jgi:hypothetical protein
MIFSYLNLGITEYNVSLKILLDPELEYAKSLCGKLRVLVSV